LHPFLFTQNARHRAAASQHLSQTMYTPVAADATLHRRYLRCAENSEAQLAASPKKAEFLIAFCRLAGTLKKI